jgi:hypothetical protein
MIKTFTVNLPAHWASYLINDDPSSFALHDDGDAELARIDQWVANNSAHCVDVKEDVFFMPFGSLDCPGELPGDYARYTFQEVD